MYFPNPQNTAFFEASGEFDGKKPVFSPAKSDILILLDKMILPDGVMLSHGVYDNIPLQP